LRFELLCDLLNDQGSFNGQNIISTRFFYKAYFILLGTSGLLLLPYKK